jgi:hypothetical protein
VQDIYNKEIHARLKKSIWNAGCQSWYLTKDGKNTTLWPGFTFEYRARTKQFNPSDYTIITLEKSSSNAKRAASLV